MLDEGSVPRTLRVNDSMLRRTRHPARVESVNAACRWCLLLLLSTGCTKTPAAEEVAPWPEHPWDAADLVPCPRDDGALADLRGRLSAPLPAIAKESFAQFGGRIADDPARLGNLHELQSSPVALSCFAGNLAARADQSILSDHPRVALIADAAAAMGIGIDVGGALSELDAATLGTPRRRRGRSVPLREPLRLASAPIRGPCSRRRLTGLFGLIKGQKPGSRMWRTVT
jgi:hypothetical protein